MYKFKKVIDPQNRFDNVEIEHSADVVTTSDLAEAFYFFAVGCGYMSESVISGMQEVIEQYGKEEPTPTDPEDWKSCVEGSCGCFNDPE
jgi:hypothetical protein